MVERRRHENEPRPDTLPLDEQQMSEQLADADEDALQVDRSVPIDQIEAEPAGVQEIRELDTTLGAAASGVLLEVDIETAKQRLHDVQVILTALGYMSGEHGDPGAVVTGVWGPDTRDAVAEFQSDHDLGATGQIDAETYEALLAEHEVALGARRDDTVKDDFSPMDPDKPLSD